MDFREFRISKGVSDEDFGNKTPAEIAGLHNEWSSERFKNLDEAVKNAATPEQVKEAKDALETFKSENAETLKGFVKTEEVEELKKGLQEAQEEISSLKEGGVDKTPETQNEALKAVHKENKEKIMHSVKEKKDFNFVVKANTVTASISGHTNSMRLMDISQLAYRKLSLRDAFSSEVVPDNTSGLITYVDWDEATSVRAAATRAEGAVFPESTATWIERSIRMKKIGDSIPISEEFAKDDARFVGEVTDFLNINVALEEDSQLYSGDGLANNLEGVFTSAPVLDITTLANQPLYNGIVAANLYDLIVKTKEFIARGKKSKFNPDIVMLNMKQINDLMLTKNLRQDYLNPPFVVNSDGNMVIAGCRVIETNNVAADTMVVGDSRYAKIYEGDQYTLTSGHINDQFGRDLATLKARKRMLLLIKESNKQGFAKVNNIAASLVQLAS